VEDIEERLDRSTDEIELSEISVKNRSHHNDTSLDFLEDEIEI
jgi:hypothetical protein